jgi:hypothetical protein
VHESSEVRLEAAVDGLFAPAEIILWWNRTVIAGFLTGK